MELMWFLLISGNCFLDYAHAIEITKNPCYPRLRPPLLSAECSVHLKAVFHVAGIVVIIIISVLSCKFTDFSCMENSNFKGHWKIAMGKSMVILL